MVREMGPDDGANPHRLQLLAGTDAEHVSSPLSPLLLHIYNMIQDASCFESLLSKTKYRRRNAHNTRRDAGYLVRSSMFFVQWRRTKTHDLFRLQGPVTRPISVLKVIAVQNRVSP